MRIPYEILASYVDTALWSSGDDGEFDDLSIDDVSAECLDAFKTDLDEFYNQAHRLLNTDNQPYTTIAHDFWLTRNGHGAGFWDGDYPVQGDALTKLSKTFGPCDLYLGDDNLIYCL